MSSKQNILTLQKDLGEEFRVRRQEMNLSLKEVAAATSIRMVHLEAIENGDVQAVISPVYARGFIEQYGIFLGLQSEELRKRLAGLFPKEAMHMETNLTERNFSYGIGSLEVRGSPGNGVKWLPGVAWIIGFALLGFAAWGLAKFLGVI